MTKVLHAYFSEYIPAYSPHKLLPLLSYIFHTGHTGQDPFGHTVYLRFEKDGYVGIFIYCLVWIIVNLIGYLLIHLENANSFPRFCISLDKFECVWINLDRLEGVC